MKQQIVDKNDNLIGVKDRRDINYEEEIYRVAALWLTNSKNETLIAKRSSQKDKDPGLWGMAVAGTLEEGETYESNIYKEAEEEIGLTGVKFKTGPRIFNEYPRRFFCQWFLATCDWPLAKFKKQVEEVDKIKWIATDELKSDITNHPEKYVSQIKIVVERFS